MIDYEVKIFNKVYATAAPLCAKNMVVSAPFTNAPTGFPAVCLYELDNRTVRNRQSSTPVENYAQVTYQLDVYATTKSKCREIFSAADNVMMALNFTRISGQFTDNLGNTKVFRYVGRYQAVVDPDGNLYRTAS